MFRETFNPYRPSVIDWPKLSAETVARLQALPIWDIAVHTEGKARLSMAAYARLVKDPDMRSAIALNAWEENRRAGSESAWPAASTGTAPKLSRTTTSL